MLNNVSLWADIFLARNGANPDPQNFAFNPALVHHVRKRMFLAFYFFCATIHAVLTPYLPRIKVRREKNLLNKDGASRKTTRIRRKGGCGTKTTRKAITGSCWR